MVETRTKCDVIPVWMFRELDASAVYKIKVQKELLYRARNERLDNLNPEKEKAVWESVKGKTIEECFHFDDYGLLKLNKNISDKIDIKFKKIKKEIEDELEVKSHALDEAYESWKLKVLTGKIPRSRVKEFEI